MSLQNGYYSETSQLFSFRIFLSSNLRFQGTLLSPGAKAEKCTWLRKPWPFNAKGVQKPRREPVGFRWLRDGQLEGFACFVLFVCQKTTSFFSFRERVCFLKWKNGEKIQSFLLLFLLLESFSGLPQSYIVADCHGWPFLTQGVRWIGRKWWKKPMKNPFEALRELHLVVFPLRVPKNIKTGCTLGDAISYYHISFRSEFSKKLGPPS